MNQAGPFTRALRSASILRGHETPHISGRERPRLRIRQTRGKRKALGHHLHDRVKRERGAERRVETSQYTPDDDPVAVEQQQPNESARATTAVSVCRENREG
jgi:hypothetical protein